MAHNIAYTGAAASPAAPPREVPISAASRPTKYYISPSSSVKEVPFSCTSVPLSAAAAPVLTCLPTVPVSSTPPAAAGAAAYLPAGRPEYAAATYHCIPAGAAAPPPPTCPGLAAAGGSLRGQPAVWPAAAAAGRSLPAFVTTGTSSFAGPTTSICSAPTLVTAVGVTAETSLRAPPPAAEVGATARRTMLPPVVCTGAAAADQRPPSTAMRQQTAATAQQQQLLQTHRHTVQLLPDQGCTCCGWLVSPTFALLAVCGSWMLFGGADGEVVLLLAAAPGLVILCGAVASAGKKRRISVGTLSECFWLGALVSVGLAMTVELLCNTLLSKTPLSFCVPTPLVHLQRGSRLEQFSSDTAAASRLSPQFGPLLAPAALHMSSPLSFAASHQQPPVVLQALLHRAKMPSSAPHRLETLSDSASAFQPAASQLAASPPPAAAAVWGGFSAAAGGGAAEAARGASLSSRGPSLSESFSSPVIEGSSLPSYCLLSVFTAAAASPSSSLSSFLDYFSQKKDELSKTSLAATFSQLFLQKSVSAAAAPPGVRASKTDTASSSPPSSAYKSQSFLPLSFSSSLSSWWPSSLRAIQSAFPTYRGLPSAMPQLLSFLYRRARKTTPDSAADVLEEAAAEAKTAAAEAKTAAAASQAAAEPASLHAAAAGGTGDSGHVTEPAATVVRAAAGAPCCQQQQPEALATPPSAAVTAFDENNTVSFFSKKISFLQSLLPPLSLLFYFPLGPVPRERCFQAAKEEAAAPAARGSETAAETLAAGETLTQMEEASETATTKPAAQTFLRSGGASAQAKYDDVETAATRLDRRNPRDAAALHDRTETAGYAAATRQGAATADAAAVDAAESGGVRKGAAEDSSVAEDAAETGHAGAARTAGAAASTTTGAAVTAENISLLSKESESLSLTHGGRGLAAAASQTEIYPPLVVQREAAAGERLTEAGDATAAAVAVARYRSRREHRRPPVALSSSQPRLSRQQQAPSTFWCALVLVIFMVLCVGLVEELSKLLMLSRLQILPVALAEEKAEPTASTKCRSTKSGYLRMIRRLLMQWGRYIWTAAWPRRVVYPLDACLAACAVAGGFAVAENLSYTVGRYSRASVPELLLVAVIRTFTAVPAHIFNTGVAACNLAVALHSALRRSDGLIKSQELQQPLLQLEGQQQPQDQNPPSLRHSWDGALHIPPASKVAAAREGTAGWHSSASCASGGGSYAETSSCNNGRVINSFNCSSFFALIPGKTASSRLQVLLQCVAPSALLHGLYDAALQLSAAFAQLSGGTEFKNSHQHTDADTSSCLAAGFAIMFLLAAAAAWTCSAVLFFRGWRKVRSLGPFLPSRTSGVATAEPRHPGGGIITPSQAWIHANGSDLK